MKFFHCVDQENIHTLTKCPHKNSIVLKYVHTNNTKISIKVHIHMFCINFLSFEQPEYV